MDNKQLTVIAPGAQYRNLPIEQIKEIAGAMVNAKMFPDLESANTAFVKILAGQEMGVSPFQAMSGIHIIKGKATLAANLMATKLMESGRYRYRVIVLTDDIAHIDFQAMENGKWVKIGESRFTKEDATKLGTQNMGRFPRNMLFARAMSNGVKWFAPDVFGGAPVYVEGEVIDEDTGETIPTEEETAKRQIAEKQERLKNAAKAGSRRTEAKVAEQAPTEEVVEETADPDRVETSEPQPPADTKPTTTQTRRIMAQLSELGFKTDDEKHAVYTGLTGHESFKELTADEAPELIDQLQKAIDNDDAEGMRVMFVGESDAQN